LTVHRNPDQVKRLVRRLTHPRVDIYLHVDRRIDPAPYATAGATIHPDPTPVVWGSWDLVEATQRLLEFARQRGRYSHFTHLSGQDYPLLPIDRIVEAIGSSQGQILDMQWSKQDRSHRWAPYSVTTSDPVAHFLQRLYMRYLRYVLRRRSRPLPEGLSFACGSALWTLTDQAVDWIFRFVRTRPDVPRFFRNTLNTSEMFYQILLQASPFRDQLGEHRHYIDWNAGLSHPKTLGVEDFPALAASHQWFARKFDTTVDEQILDRIDAEMLRVAT